MSPATLGLKSPRITFEDIIQDKLRPDVQRIDHEGYYPESFMQAYGEAGAFYPVTEPGNFIKPLKTVLWLVKLADQRHFQFGVIIPVFGI